MTDLKVPLERKFSPIKSNNNDENSDELFHAYLLLEKPKNWLDLENEYRVIILADAGAGKTYETLNRAAFAHEKGHAAFFIRIEDIDVNFEDAFEVGSSDEFSEWLDSSDEAWFFLDSVDEARLENPQTFKKAIRRFAHRIRLASHRAHIFITSRPYAWRFKSDTELIEQLLPFSTTQKEQEQGAEVATSNDMDTSTKKDSPLNIYGLKPLDVDDIRKFAQYHSTPDFDQLINEIERKNLFELASRPFDLEGLLSKWKSDGELGSRLESLQHIVDIRLNEIDPSRSQRQPLSQQKSREGVCLLAAAVTLSGETGILVPDTVPVRTGVDAEQVLADWDQKDIRALLERGIFNDIVYGAIRFRHRDIRELLTAEWLHSLLQKGGSRRQIESLLIREQYGEKVLVPRLRPILPWLILFDRPIRDQALNIHPETAVEGGDPAYLPLQTRQALLNDIVCRIASDHDDRSARDNSAIARIAHPDLSEDVRRLIVEHKDNDDAIFFLGRLVWQGDMTDCLVALPSIAADPDRSIYPRIACLRALSCVGTNEQSKSTWAAINDQPSIISRRLLAELIQEAEPDDQAIDLLLTSINKLPPYERYETSGLDQALHKFLDRFNTLAIQEREPLLVQLCIGLNALLSREPHLEQRECRVSKDFFWLMEPASHAIEILVIDRCRASLATEIMGIVLKIPALRFWDGHRSDEYKTKLKTAIPAWPEFNDRLFWQCIAEARVWLEEDGKRLTDDWDVQWLGHYWCFDADSFDRVVAYIQCRELEDDQLVALSLAFRIYTQAESPKGWGVVLDQATTGNEVLTTSLQQLRKASSSKKREKWEQERLEAKQKREKKRQEDEQSRSRWIKRLRNNPDRIRNVLELRPDKLTNDVYWLYREIKNRGRVKEYAVGADWRALIYEFGDDVAYVFCDTAIKYWRLYKPKLKSEGADTSSIVEIQT